MGELQFTEVHTRSIQGDRAIADFSIHPRVSYSTTMRCLLTILTITILLLLAGSNEGNPRYYLLDTEDAGLESVGYTDGPVGKDGYKTELEPAQGEDYHCHHCPICCIGLPHGR